MLGIVQNLPCQPAPNRVMAGVNPDRAMKASGDADINVGFNCVLTSLLHLGLRIEAAGALLCLALSSLGSLRGRLGCSLNHCASTNAKQTRVFPVLILIRLHDSSFVSMTHIGSTDKTRTACLNTQHSASPFQQPLILSPSDLDSVIFELELNTSERALHPCRCSGTPAGLAC